MAPHSGLAAGNQGRSIFAKGIILREEVAMVIMTGQDWVGLAKVLSGTCGESSFKSHL